MNAKEFYLEFLKRANKDLVADNGRKYFDIYKKYEKEYTTLVNKNIIAGIIKDAGFTPQHEYFRIDTVGWVSQYEKMQEDAKKNNIHLKAHLWDLRIAVEHENNKQDWTDEVIKLIHIKCPLKVVIGYNYCDRRQEEEREKLKFIAKWMNEVKAFHSGNNEEYLIILGNGHKKDDYSKDYDDFEYKGYIYNYLTKAFEIIEL